MNNDTNHVRKLVCGEWKEAGEEGGRGGGGRLENFTLREDKHVAMSRHMQGSELDYFMVENQASSASSDRKKKRKKLTRPVTSLVIRCPREAGCPHKNPGRFMTADYCVYG